MAEYVTKEQVIDWFRPYGHMDEPIPFETMVSDLRGMPSADVAPVRNGRWVEHKHFNHDHYIDSTYECSECNVEEPLTSDYCPNCGAKMGG